MCTICKTFPFNFSIRVKWIDLEQHLASFNREVVAVQGDGFCFLEAVRKSLLVDHNEEISIMKMIKMVMYELYEQLHQYSQFHQGSNQQLIIDAKRFFKKKEY